MSEIDPFIVWCAGFFDGEGSICIPRGSRPGASRVASAQMWLQVTVTQSVKQPLLDIQERFGGRVTRMSQPKDKFVRRPLWRWIGDSDVGADFLKAMRPYLRVKNRQADLAFEFQATMRKYTKRSPTQEILDLRLRIKNEITAINREECLDVT